MNVPENLKYTKNHEWALIDGDTATFGISDYAQSELGDIVYVELPEVGDVFACGDSVGTIEAVKTVSDIYAPVGGEVTEINETLNDTSDLVNKDPYGEGWIVKVKITDAGEVDALLSAEDYSKLIG